MGWRGDICFSLKNIFSLNMDFVPFDHSLKQLSALVPVQESDISLDDLCRS